MTTAIRPVEAFQDLVDGPGTLTADHEAMVPVWSQAAKRFIMVKLPPARGGSVVAAGPGGLFTIRYAGDGPGDLDAGDDGKFLAWDNDLQRFVMATGGGGGGGGDGDADTLDGHDSTYFLPAASYTAADVLAKILTVDGPSSGLNADLLDGLNSTQLELAGAADAAIADHVAEPDPHTQYLLESDYTAADVLAKVKTVDGSGSGLDADLLDGQSGAHYLDRANHTGTQTASTISNFDEAAQDAVGAALTDTATVDLAYNDGAGQITATVIDDSITDGKLRNSGALSVIGRSANSTGDPADISAGNDGEVLRRSGTALGFGTVATAGITDDAVTNAKAANMAQNTIKGRITGSTGDPEDLTASQVIDILETADGSGSGLDADTVDGQHAAAFEAAGAAATHAALTAAHGATGAVVGTTNSQTLTNKTLTTPTIGDFSNAGHTHQNSAGGGQLDHGAALTGLGDDDHTQYLLATGARVGASSQPQAFTYNPQAPWWDGALNDATNGSHFNDNNGSYPSGWTEVDASFASASAPAGTSYRYGFWRLNGDPTDTSWKYKKQTGINIEGLAANTFQSFTIGPLIFRDGAYAADVNYYFGVYRDNSGIDDNRFIRAHVWWDSANTLWKIRGECKDGTTETDGSWYTLPLPLVQPLYIRLRIRFASPRTVRAYVGYVNSPISDFLLIDNNVGTVTMGNVWWQFHMSRSTGVNDYLLIGGIDTSQDP